MANEWGPKPPNVPLWIQASVAADAGVQAAQVAANPSGSLSTAPAPPPTINTELKIGEYPRHLYPPRNVKTLDMRIVRQMNPGEVFNLIDFTPKLFGIYGAVYITHYAVFNDGLLEADYSFLPTVNSMRIYPYHGNPQNTRAPGTFLISLGLAPDEANYALIPGFFILNPEDRYVWQATNGSIVTTNMGVRVTGYIDESSKRQTQLFGG